MTQQKRGRPEGSGKLQRAILAYLNEIHIIQQSAISANILKDFIGSERVVIKQPAINRALRMLEKQGTILRFKSWHPHPLTDRKKLLSYVVLPDSTLCGIPARESVAMLEIRNGGSQIPWSVAWLQTQYFEWTGIVLSAKATRKILAYINDRILDAIGNPDDDDKVWMAVAREAVAIGGILKFGERHIAEWRQSVEVPDNVKGNGNKRYVLTHNDKSEPESSSPPPAEVVIPVEENGIAMLDRRVADLQKRISKAG